MSSYSISYESSSNKNREDLLVIVTPTPGNSIERAILDILPYTTENREYLVRSDNSGFALIKDGNVMRYNLDDGIIPAFIENDEFIDDNLFRMSLTNLRKSKHVTQKQLASMSELSVGTISNIETTGTVQNATLSSIVKYITPLGYELSIRKKNNY